MAVKGLLALPVEADKEPGDDEDASSVGRKAACEDMISAFKRGDPKALDAALQDYLDLGSPMPEMMSKEENDEEA